LGGGAGGGGGGGGGGGEGSGLGCGRSLGRRRMGEGRLWTPFGVEWRAGVVSTSAAAHAVGVGVCLAHWRMGSTVGGLV